MPEWAEGSRLGWFLGGIFIVAFLAVGYWIYTRIKARREEEGKLK